MVRQIFVYVLIFFVCTNKCVFSTVGGILGEESDSKSVELEASGSEIDPLLAELDKVHQLESHVLDAIIN